MTGFIIKSFDLVIRIGFVLNMLGFAAFGAMTAQSMHDSIPLGLLLGGIVGFLSSVIIFGALLVLLQIEKNTRRTPT